MKKLGFLVSALAITTLIGCNGDKPTPTPTPETYYNIEITSQGAKFGSQTDPKDYYTGKIKKNTGFTTTFYQLDGYEKIEQSSFSVKIGGQESVYGWRFNSVGNSFTLDDSAVTGDIKIICKVDPIKPKEEYTVTNNLSHSKSDTEYPLPEKVNKGEMIYAYLLPEDDNYRLPNPDDKKHTKDSSIEVLAKSRRLERGTDYQYFINEDGSATLYIPSETIEENITIKGEGIRLYSVSFNPVSRSDSDGQWSGGGTESKSIKFDEDTNVGDAFKKIGISSPESTKKAEGYRFDTWTDKVGTSISSTHVISESENNTTFYGKYVLSQCYINYEELYNIMPPQGQTIMYKTEYSTTLQPKDNNYVMPLNKDFVLKRKDAKTQEVTLMEEGVDKDYEYTLNEDRSSADFKIHADSVIGNFHVYGRCPEYYTITIDPNGGTIGSHTETWTTHAIQGDSLKTLLDQEQITQDPTPPQGEHFTGWTFQGTSIDKDYKFTASGTLKATYGSESFETVSWNKLASQTSSMSFEKLKIYYGVDSFVGMEKKITAPINGDQTKTREIMVRVIGENHDVKTDSNKALLTFEFEEIINKNVAYWTDNNYWNEYEFSELRKEMAKESTMLETLNNFSIASVDKKTMRGGKNDATYKDQVTTQEKLFALSGVEIGISGEQPREKMNPDTTLYNTSRFNEGTVYSYYSLSQVNPKMREKDWLKPAEGEEPAEYIPTSYLLRTPHALSFNDPVAKKDQSGYYGIFGSSESQFKDKNGRYDRFHDTLIGIAPAFAI